MTVDAREDLERRFHRAAVLDEACDVLEWDRAVMAPPGAAGGRAEQLALLRSAAHDLRGDPAVGELLERAGDGGGDRWRRANLAEMRRQWRRATAVPRDLVEAEARAAARCEAEWREARAASDFGRVRPALAEVVRLARERAGALAGALGCTPYEALADEHEPDLRTAEIDALFDEIAGFLPDIVERARAAAAGRGAPAPCVGRFAEGRQRRLALQVMEALGFDLERGRLDVSAHPFTGGCPDDIRITTRYDEGDFAEGLSAVIHETGHALYEAGRPREWRYQPVGRARGMTLHESQALLLENQVGRSLEFLTFAAPLMREAFGGRGPAWEAGNLHALHRRVEPGPIRVKADEVTYPLHIVLRYRIERALIAGDMEVDDVPGAWGRWHGDLLGLRPPGDRDGCLQDIHWYQGAWGYFPTYTLGALAAAQIHAAAREALPGLAGMVSRGEFAPLVAWLGANVHGPASSATTGEIIEAATGAPLGAAAFRAHLEARYC